MIAALEAHIRMMESLPKRTIPAKPKHQPSELVRKRIAVRVDGKFYPTMMAASLETGYSSTKIYKMLRSGEAQRV